MKVQAVKATSNHNRGAGSPFFTCAANLWVSCLLPRNTSLETASPCSFHNMLMAICLLTLLAIPVRTIGPEGVVPALQIATGHVIEKQFRFPLPSRRGFS